MVAQKTTFASISNSTYAKVHAVRAIHELPLREKKGFGYYLRKSCQNCRVCRLPSSWKRCSPTPTSSTITSRGGGVHSPILAPISTTV